MLSNWKSIAIMLGSHQSDMSHSIRYAARLASQCDAHLIAVFNVGDLPNLSSYGNYAIGKTAIDSVIAHRRTQEETAAREAGELIANLARQYGVSAEFRVVWNWQSDNHPTLHSLHSDLVIVEHAQASQMPDALNPETIAMETGVPVLILPQGWTPTDGTEAIDTILVAWNGSREARRAVADAMPFLTAATQVHLLIVDGETKTGTEPQAGAPGADVAHYLARHKVPVEIDLQPSYSRPINEVIVSRARHLKADLVVIGAYSSGRTAQRFFGGVTRSLLAHAPVPLLISH